jgi:O-antigen/teichoic acid export membrane protein
VSRSPSSGGRAGERASIPRNAGLAFAANLATAGFTALITLYLVRALDPEGYGVLALALSFSGLLILPADFGISPSAARFIAEHRGDDRAVAAVLFKALRLKLVLTAAVGVLLIVLAEPIASLYNQPDLVWPLRAVAVALFGQSLVFLFSSVFVALGRVSGSLVLILFEAACEAIATIGLVMLAGGATAAAVGRAIGYTAGAVFGLILLFRLLGRHTIRERTGGPSGRQLARYAGALLLVDSAYAVFTQVDILLVGIIVNTTAAGIYGAPIKLTVLLSYPGLSISNAISPRLARHSTDEPDVGALLGGLRLLSYVQAFMAAVLLVWAEPIVDVVLGPGYEGSVGVLRILSGLVLVSGLGPLASLSVNFLGEARRRVPITVACLTLHVIGTIILVNAIGIEGAAISVDVAYGVYVIAHLRICSQLLGFSLRPLARTTVSALASGAALAAVLFAFGTDSLTIIDWIAGLCLGAVAFMAAVVATRGSSIVELRALAGRARATLQRA